MRSDRERLLDIIEAADHIGRYARLGEERFRRDELVQTWMRHHLQILGEAAAALSEETRQRMPDIPWRQIIGMRHILVHQYFAVDLDVVWQAASHDAPELRAAAQALADQVA